MKVTLPKALDSSDTHVSFSISQHTKGTKLVAQIEKQLLSHLLTPFTRFPVDIATSFNSSEKKGNEVRLEKRIEPS